MYADLVLLLTALLAGGVIVAFVHSCARRESCESHDVLRPLPLPAPREVQQ